MVTIGALFTPEDAKAVAGVSCGPMWGILNRGLAGAANNSGDVRSPALSGCIQCRSQQAIFDVGSWGISGRGAEMVGTSAYSQNRTWAIASRVH